MQRNLARFVATFIALSACGDPEPITCRMDEGCDVPVVCGDGVAASGETCDGTDLRGESCASRGFDGGELGCAADCGDFDASACARCGDSACTIGEDTASCAEDCFMPSLAFTADVTGDDVGLELFVTDAAGSLVVKLSGLLAPGASVFDFRWSPDRAWIAYVVEQSTGVLELYVGPAAGGTPVRIAGDGFAGEHAWAPDSSRIAYVSDHETNDVRELYTAFPSGGGTVRISGPLVLGDSVGAVAWAPDSTRIAYQVSGMFGSSLLVDSPTGGGRVVIHGAAFPTRSLGTWTWAPDASRIAFIADRDTEGVQELYTSLPDGSGIIKVSGTLVLGGDVREFKLAPDSSRIAYLADQDADAIVALYTSLLSGGMNVRVSGASSESVFGARWAGDGAHLAFGIGSELFTGLATGGGSVSLDSTASESFEWSPDGSRIAYLRFGANGSELGTSLPGGGAVASIAEDPNRFGWAPDSSRIAFDRDNDLFTALPTGGGEIAISTVGDSASTLQLEWAPGGAHIAFIVANYSAQVHELHVSPSSGGGSVKVSGSMTLNVLLASFAWAPES